MYVQHYNKLRLHYLANNGFIVEVDLRTEHWRKLADERLEAANRYLELARSSSQSSTAQSTEGAEHE